MRRPFCALVLVLTACPRDYFFGEEAETETTGGGDASLSGPSGAGMTTPSGDTTGAGSGGTLAVSEASVSSSGNGGSATTGESSSGAWPTSFTESITWGPPTFTDGFSTTDWTDDSSGTMEFTTTGGTSGGSTGTSF